MSNIKVQYVGKGDARFTEYDGVKYCFSKTNPIQFIPIEVYNNFQSPSNPFRDELLPVTDTSDHVQKAIPVPPVQENAPVEETPTVEPKKSKKKK